MSGLKSKNRGSAFEKLVRKDLEKNGWIVCKWSNNVELSGELEADDKQIPYGCKFKMEGKLIPSKHKFNPFTKSISYVGTGMPDFIAFKVNFMVDTYEIIGVESKMLGRLSREEKEKCKWYLTNKIFSKILIAKQGVDKKIEYEVFNPNI
jgi:hypothetical protein